MKFIGAARYLWLHQINHIAILRMGATWKWNISVVHRSPMYSKCKFMALPSLKLQFVLCITSLPWFCVGFALFFTRKNGFPKAYSVYSTVKLNSVNHSHTGRNKKHCCITPNQYISNYDVRLVLRLFYFVPLVKYSNKMRHLFCWNYPIFAVFPLANAWNFNCWK